MDTTPLPSRKSAGKFFSVLFLILSLLATRAADLRLVSTNLYDFSDAGQIYHLRGEVSKIYPQSIGVSIASRTGFHVVKTPPIPASEMTSEDLLALLAAFRMGYNDDGSSSDNVDKSVVSPDQAPLGEVPPPVDNNSATEPMTQPIYGLQPIPIKLQNELTNTLTQTDELDAMVERGCSFEEFTSVFAPIEESAVSLQDDLPSTDPRMHKRNATTETPLGAKKPRAGTRSA
jgi:hypothetical protein